MRPEKKAISKQTAKVQVGVEGFDVLVGAVVAVLSAVGGSPERGARCGCWRHARGHAPHALVPHAQTAQAIAALEGEMLQQTSAVALVGHEPHLGYLLGSLVTGHPRISIPFGRGQLVGLETESTTSLTTTMRFSMRQSLAAKLT